MPNGESKNWIRFQITLETFHDIYGHWPSVINLYPFFIEELKDKLSGQDFETVQSRISLVPDEEHPFLAMDDSGNVYDYCHGLEGKTSQSREPNRCSDLYGISESGVTQAGKRFEENKKKDSSLEKRVLEIAGKLSLSIM